MNIPYKKMAGEGAFYGPKIDIKLIDAIGRPWQLTTVQFDFNLPARFGLQYVGDDGARHQPLMVHRALLGSVERFFGILIEHYAGAFPLWLAPVQVGICPVSEKVIDYAKHVLETLKNRDIRVHLDDRNEKLPAKIRDAQMQKIPYMLVVGPKEAEAGTVSVRHRSKATSAPSLSPTWSSLCAKNPFPARPDNAAAAIQETPMVTMLDELIFRASIRTLAVRDSDLARVVETYGVPPLWVREPGFASLVYIILEQQVSLASARAAFQRLRLAANPLTPGRFLTLSDMQLKEIGFSRQKTLYIRLLAESLAKKYLDLNDLGDLSDDAARKFLIALKGIGIWTADIYLLSALRRPDVWPIGDLALAIAVQEVKRLRSRPSPERLEKISQPWRPHRAAAARLFWHAYLSKRGQNSATISL